MGCCWPDPFHSVSASKKQIQALNCVTTLVCGWMAGHKRGSQPGGGLTATTSPIPLLDVAISPCFMSRLLLGGCTSPLTCVFEVTYGLLVHMALSTYGNNIMEYACTYWQWLGSKVDSNVLHLDICFSQTPFWHKFWQMGFATVKQLSWFGVFKCFKDRGWLMTLFPSSSSSFQH